MKIKWWMYIKHMFYHFDKVEEKTDLNGKLISTHRKCIICGRELNK